MFCAFTPGASLRTLALVSDGPPIGTVFLVGAGPGDPALLTRRGADLLADADVVVFDGLVNPVLLDLAPAAAERLYAGKKHADLGEPMRQGQINQRLIELARAGKRVVRLKGGDPFVFGRGAEEGRELAAAGVPFEVVPGVSSATAASAYAGIPLTARNVASTVAYATGHEAAGKPESAVDWQGLARADTVVLFMALKTLPDCAAALIAAGKSPGTPAAAIYWGTTAAQRTIVAPLEQLPNAVTDAGLRPPVLIVVGDVVELRKPLAWFESLPLFGARILSTRRLEQSRAFASELATLGAEPVFAPVTRLEPPADSSPIDRAVDALGDYRWWLFTSANAVQRWFDECERRGIDGRSAAGARLACVGRVTAAALRERGLIADLVPQHGDGEAIARAMVDADAQGLAGARVLMPRAADGRVEAGDILSEAGAEVDVVPVYRTVAAEPGDPSVLFPLRRLRQGEIDAVAFFAPSQVRALFDICRDQDPVALLERCALIAAIGNTTARALRDRGVRVDLIPSTPDARVMARELASAYTSRGADTGPND